MSCDLRPRVPEATAADRMDPHEQDCASCRDYGSELRILVSQLSELPRVLPRFEEALPIRLPIEAPRSRLAQWAAALAAAVIVAATAAILLPRVPPGDSGYAQDPEVARQVDAQLPALTAEDIQGRDAAREALIKLGPKALPTLRDRLSKAGGAAKTEIERIIRTLEVRSLKEQIARHTPDFAQYPAVPPASSKIPKGRLLWSAELEGCDNAGLPVPHRDTLIVPSNNMLLAVDRASRKVVWRTSLPGDAQPPVPEFDVSGLTLDGDRLFVTNADYGVGFDRGHVVCCDATSGRILWSASLDGATAASPLVLGPLVIVACTCATPGGDRTYAVQALDRRTGATVWKSEAVEMGFFARPVLVDDLLIVTGDVGTVWAFDVATGETRWKSEPRTLFADTLLLSGRVLVSRETRRTGISHQLKAFDIDTRRVLWQHDGPARASGYAMPAIHDGAVFATFQDPDKSWKLGAIDLRTGRAQWTRALAGQDRSTPLVAGNAVYLAWRDEVTAFETATGKTSWSLGLGAGARGPAQLLLHDGVLYACVLDGKRMKLVAID